MTYCLQFQILALFLLWYFLRSIRIKKPEVQGRNFTPSITVLVACKNEEDNIPILISCLQAQEYPAFQVLLVNDRSTDKTEKKMAEICKKDKRFHYINVPETVPLGKKSALQYSLDQLDSDYIAFTDADCRMGSSWLQTASTYLSDKTEILIGYSPLLQSKTQLLQHFQNLWTAWQYIGSASQGRPYMTVGRNWFVKTEFYKTHHNLYDHLNIRSGDDDLVAQKLFLVGNHSWMYAKETRVFTKAYPTLEKWLRAMHRHKEAAHAYTLKALGQSLVFPVFLILFLINFLFLNTLGQVISLIAYYTLFQYFLRNIRDKLEVQNAYLFPFLLPFILLLELISMLSYFSKKEFH